MRRQRATSADQLSQVIEVIELGRRTGLLSVERTDQAGLEEGDIYFVQGEAIYACTGTKTGRIALETLRTWQACRFAFLAHIPPPSPNIGPAIRGSRPSQTGSTRSIGPIAQPPLSPTQRPGARPFSGPPAPSPRWGLTSSHRPKRGPNAQDIPRLAASYQLSWAHRALLLRADGEHTVAELARLSNRSEEEVLRLLADLLQLGLITLLP
jgi:hypothetical protein